MVFGNRPILGLNLHSLSKHRHTHFKLTELCVGTYICKQRLKKETQLSTLIKIEFSITHGQIWENPREVTGFDGKAFMTSLARLHSQHRLDPSRKGQKFVCINN